jgi:predicted DsbA family dithiol-disulfide isomerase
MDTMSDGGAPLARIDVISDAICPWCYIGKRQLERALPLLEQEGLHFSVMWHPYQLNPDMPAEGVDRKTYREAKFGGAERAREIDVRITATAATLGLEFHLVLFSGAQPAEQMAKAFHQAWDILKAQAA